MGMKRTEMTKVEVDMVPLIDIVSLLLMFLVMVGDSSKSASAVKMKLPRASESKKDTEVPVEGRIVVQLKAVEGGKYQVVIDNRIYELAGGKNSTLHAYFDEQIAKRKGRGDIKEGPQGQIDGIPVKLRVPTDAPMSQVQQLIMTIANARLTNVQYAVDNNSK